MSKYTIAQFRADVNFVSATSPTGKPREMHLPAYDYISLLQECWPHFPASIRKDPSAYTTFNFDWVTLIPIYQDGSTIPDWDNILEEYGRGYVSHNPRPPLGNYIMLIIGLWTYGVLLSRSSSAIIQPVSATTCGAVPSPPSPQMLTQEPPCLCSSRSLVTIGHEQGCRWLLWKSSGGAK